jgi:hypothetical protein
MRRFAAALGALACGCLSKPPPPGSGSCAGTVGWTTPTHLTELDVLDSQAAPYLSPDRKEIWFTAINLTTFGDHVYRATRPGPTGTFGTPVAVPELDTNEIEQVFLSDNLLEAWFVHMQGDLDIVEASRPQVGAHFGMASDIALDNPSSSLRSEADPTVTSDSLTMVMTLSDPGSGSPGDLALSHRASALVDFPQPTLITSVNTGSDECCASISADGTSLLFASNRTGDYKLYEADRADASAEFGADRPFTGGDLRTGVDNADPALSRDGTTIIYASDAGLGTRYALYQIDQTCAP